LRRFRSVVSSHSMSKNGGKDWWKTIGLIILILAMVIAGTAVYERFKRRHACPSCGEALPQDAPRCDACGAKIQWR
jgi:hypothetical protein